MVKNKFPIQFNVRLILLNESNELLLMCIDDPKTKSVGKEYNGRFWTMIGGQVEVGETIMEAATRELFEETRMSKKNVEFGPLVWQGEFDLILRGKPTHIRQQFIVVKTKKKTFSLAGLTQDEVNTVKHLSWFSLDKIINSTEIIYPILLPNYLSDIIAGKYPNKPLKINLATEQKCN